jgi:hypothetical protein
MSEQKPVGSCFSDVWVRMLKSRSGWSRIREEYRKAIDSSKKEAIGRVFCFRVEGKIRRTANRFCTDTRYSMRKITNTTYSLM